MLFSYIKETWNWEPGPYWCLLCRVFKMMMVKYIGLRLGKASSIKHTKMNFTNLKCSRTAPGGGGHSTFFQVGVCGPYFRSVGLANWHLPLKRGACERKISKLGGLWAENFQIWGLVSWKFPNLGACELKFGWKLRLLRLKFPHFLKRGSCELTLLLEMGPLRAAGEAWKGGLQGRTSPYPLSRSVPPPPGELPSMCCSRL